MRAPTEGRSRFAEGKEARLETMSTEPTRRPFTVFEFEQMGRAGIFAEDDRVELLDGDIVTMSPIGDRHAACVKRLNARLGASFRDQLIVSVQDPIRLDDFSTPQPDVALLVSRDDFYSEEPPKPADVLLVVEVADSSLAFDMRVKVPLYARAGIPEVWVVDVNVGAVTVFTEPRRGVYARESVVRGDARLVSPVLGDVVLLAKDVLP